MRAGALISSIISISVLFFPSLAFADTEAAVASRIVNGGVLYYSTLHEAFAAAGGTSLDNPDEIALLADVVLDEPIVIESGKHIRLVAGDGARTITRGAKNIEYPVIWLRGHDASFTLGKIGAKDSLTIDGGYLNTPSIIAGASLAAVNGQRSRMVMYDGVTLQNNYNKSDVEGTHIYRNGGGVIVRTEDGNPDNQTEFIMRGGVIRGNTNNTQNAISCGGGVMLVGFGLFTMEGGEILGNIAYLMGGGLAVGSRGSFKKTGGVIYGENATEGLRNTVIDGIGELFTKGHSVCVSIPDYPLWRFRDGTVGEGDQLSYFGLPVGTGAFGEGEHWEIPGEDRRRLLLTGGIVVLLLGGALIFFIAGKRRKKQTAAITVSNFEEIKRSLTEREREVFDLFFTERQLKEIAEDLNISYSTAHYHTKNIYRKFGVQGRTELMVLSKKAGSGSGEGEI